MLVNGGDEVGAPESDLVEKETGEVLWFPTRTCCGVIQYFVAVCVVETGTKSVTGSHTYKLGNNQADVACGVKPTWH